MRKTIITFYLDYVNNYLTVAKIAEHNEISEETAWVMILEGRRLHEESVELFKLKAV